MKVDKEQRFVRLIKGESYFSVARDTLHPFEVDVGGARIKVLGTKFNVYKGVENTAITVLQGSVAVSRVVNKSHGALSREHDVGGVAQTVQLEVGEQAIVATQSDNIDKVQAEVENVIAWKDRRLIFNGQSLGKIINEFNRYNISQIEVGDEVLANFRFSGVFNSNDPHSLIEFLQRTHKIEVVVGSDNITRIITVQ